MQMTSEYIVKSTNIKYICSSEHNTLYLHNESRNQQTKDNT